MRSFLLALLAAFIAAFAMHLVVSAPGSYTEAFLHPIRALLGTGQQINARLLEVSESPESIRAASRRLYGLRPWSLQTSYGRLARESYRPSRVRPIHRQRSEWTWCPPMRRRAT